MKNYKLSKIAVLTSLTTCLFVSASHAQVNPVTQAYLKTNPDVYILSTNNFCHGPLSDTRSSVSLRPANVPHTNTFKTVDECKSAGGQLTEPEKIKLQTLQIVEIQRTILEAETAKKEKAKAIETKQEMAEQEEKKSNEFVGINWGLGLAFTYLSDPVIGELDIISNGTDSNGTILVKHQSNHRAIAMLESHYFIEKSWFTDCSTIQEIKTQPVHKVKPKCDTTWGHGPFIAIGITGNEEIDPLSTYGIGWMWGFRLTDLTSWNIGVGIFVDTKAKQLRPTFSDNGQTTITDKDQLTYQRDELGPMLMFSSTF